MPKSLTNRLENLENEIRVLLTLHEVEIGACQVLRGKSVTKHADGNIEHIEFEGSSCPAAKSIVNVPAPCACSPPKPEPLPPPLPRPCSPCQKKPTCICTRKNKKGEGDKSPEQECKELVDKLQNDIKSLEAKLQKSEKEKQLAANQNNELKKNLDSLCESSKLEQDELLRLKREREELFEKLEQEAAARCKLSEDAKQALAKEQKNLKDRLGKIGEHADKFAKKNRRRSDQLASAVKKRDDHIKRLSDTTDGLANLIAEKELENKKLEEKQKETLKNLLDAQHANKLLAEQNATLIRSIKDLQDKLIGEKNCVQKLMKYLEQCKVDSIRLKEKVERLRARLKSALEGPKEIRRVAKLEERLRESREREQLWLDEAAVMEARLKELEKSQEKSEINFEDELNRIYRHNKKLQSKYEQALIQMEQIKADNEKKLIEMKADFDKLACELKKKNDVLIDKRKKAERDLEVAMATALRDRKHAEELTAKVRQLEIVIQTQKGTIAEKDQKINSVQMEIMMLNDQITQLNQQENVLRNIIEKHEINVKELNAEIQEIQKTLEREREEVINKERELANLVNQIENLTNTLNHTEDQLKSALEEAKTAQTELQKGKDEMRNMAAKVEEAELKASSATAQAEKLAEAVDSLQKPPSIPPTSDYGDEAIVVDKNPITPQFERKIELLERKRELQLELLLKQRDQAVFAAKFATQRLLETVTDFQSQTSIHKKIQLLLSHLLQEKEAYIQAMEQQGCTPCDMPKKPKPQSGCCSPYCPNMY